MRLRSLAAAALVGTSFAAAPAAGFSIFGPSQDVEEAARWTAGLAGGIRVGVDAGFVAAWSPTAEDPGVVEGWVRAAFDAWENPALQFDVRFGDLDDAELVLQALPGDDPLGGFYGWATPDWEFDASRVLTNGQLVPGFTIEHARIDIAAERLQNVPGFAGLPSAAREGIVTRLFMHEIGHTIGLGHTNDFFNSYYDTDFDPANPMPIDPSDPFAGLMESPNRFVGTVMSTEPCGPGGLLCPALVTPVLSWDDIGGRDVLYPAVPEPTLFVLVATGATALAAARTRRRR